MLCGNVWSANFCYLFSEFDFDGVFDIELLMFHIILVSFTLFRVKFLILF